MTVKLQRDRPQASSNIPLLKIKQIPSFSAKVEPRNTSNNFRIALFLILQNVKSLQIKGSLKDSCTSL